MLCVCVCVCLFVHVHEIDSKYSNVSEMERARSSHSSVLAWRIPEMGEPGGLTSMGSQRVGHD